MLQAKVSGPQNPRTRAPLPLPNPGETPDRLSRNPGSGGPRGQDWSRVRVGEQDKRAERRDPCPYAQLRWTYQ